MGHNSRAVIAMGPNGHGCVIWHKGPAIENEIDEVGLYQLDDLGLDNAPLGISIWEGTYVAHRIGSTCDVPDYDMEPKGTFRQPTEEEWTSVREGRSPWGDQPRECERGEK